VTGRGTFLVPIEEISDWLDDRIIAERRRRAEPLSPYRPRKERQRHRAPDRCEGCGLRFRKRGEIDPTGQTRVHAGRGRCSSCLSKLYEQERSA